MPPTFRLQAFDAEAFTIRGEFHGTACGERLPALACAFNKRQTASPFFNP
jgi:hypothetical protein